MSTGSQIELSVDNKNIVIKKETLGLKIKSTLYRDRYLWLIVLPGLVFYIIFMYGPLYGLVICFENYSPFRGTLGGPWVGFKWFIQFFEGPYFGRLLKNTILLNIYSLLWGFPAPIIFALLLNEIKNQKFKRITQTISYLPHFISTVVIVGIVSSFVSPDTGLVNIVLKNLTGNSINFMSEPGWFRSLYIGSGVWQDLGWSCIIYLAALAGIDPQLYEAAGMDGANKFQQIWHITLPGLLPTIIILLILSMGSMFSVGYEKIILMYGSNTYETADVINTYVFRRGIAGSEYSFGTAVGLFQSVMSFALILIVNKVSRSVSDISLW